MEPEVPDEVQAAMSLKMMENVRALIRKELAAALVDGGVIHPSSMTVVASVVGTLLTSDIAFKNMIAYKLAARLDTPVYSVAASDHISDAAVQEVLRIGAHRLRNHQY